MTSYGNMIADASTVGLRYAQRLLKGIPPERFARFATPGGETIAANHPAFIVGHLCLYPAKVVQLLDYPSSDAQPPADYERLFSKDAQCQDDRDGSIYPAADALTAAFERSYAAALTALRAASDAQLSAENPVDTPMKQVCPTLGAMLTFYVTGHVTTHLGQLSTWRRMEGLPPA